MLSHSPTERTPLLQDSSQEIKMPASSLEQPSNIGVFSVLPLEVIELIINQLPTLRNMATLSAVNKFFNDLVNATRISVLFTYQLSETVDHDRSNNKDHFGKETVFGTYQQIVKNLKINKARHQHNQSLIAINNDAIAKLQSKQCIPQLSSMDRHLAHSATVITYAALCGGMPFAVSKMSCIAGTATVFATSTGGALCVGVSTFTFINGAKHCRDMQENQVRRQQHQLYTQKSTLDNESPQPLTMNKL